MWAVGKQSSTVPFLLPSLAGENRKRRRTVSDIDSLSGQQAKRVIDRKNRGPAPSEPDRVGTGFPEIPYAVRPGIKSSDMTDR